MTFLQASSKLARTLESLARRPHLQDAAAELPKLPSPPRRRNRTDDYARELARWRLFKLDHATSDADHQEIEDEYARRLKAGPPYQGKSLFMDAPATRITADEHRGILVAFDQVRDWLWHNDRKPHGQAISRNYREVLNVILSLARKFGRVYPTHAAIARMACCCERTVASALAWLRTWGFLDWQRRLKRLEGLLQQTSNGYRVLVGKLVDAINRRLGRLQQLRSTPTNVRNPHMPPQMAIPRTDIGAA
jgi:hypothetical protein